MNSVIRLTATSPIQTPTEPVTLAEVWQFCRLPDSHGDDALLDAEVRMVISACRAEAERAQGRDLVIAQYDLCADALVDGAKLRDNASSIDLVQYCDDTGTWNTVATTVYALDSKARPAQIVLKPNQGWPSYTAYPGLSVLVRFTVTPPALDAATKQGLLILIAARLQGKDKDNAPAEAALRLLGRDCVPGVFV